MQGQLVQTSNHRRPSLPLSFILFPCKNLQKEKRRKILSMSVLSRVWRPRNSSTTTPTPKQSFVYLIRTFCTSGVSAGDDLKTGASLSHKSLPLRNDDKDSNVQWVFLGCPGVGKGTYASKLSNLLGVPHIATGDLVREELASSGPLASQVCFSVFNLEIALWERVFVLNPFLEFCGELLKFEWWLAAERMEMSNLEFIAVMIWKEIELKCCKLNF